MKLRIFGSSVRFRMRPPEVAAWLESGTVSDGVRIGPRDGDRWSYRLEVTPAADWDVAVESGHWVVSVPQSAARAWADSDLVSLEHLTPWGTRITIGKRPPTPNPVIRSGSVAPSGRTLRAREPQGAGFQSTESLTPFQKTSRAMP